MSVHTLVPVPDQLHLVSLSAARHVYLGYTLHIQNGGKMTGMLSVNGYTSQVWHHNWHGDFIGMKEAGA